MDGPVLKLISVKLAFATIRLLKAALFVWAGLVFRCVFIFKGCLIICMDEQMEVAKH